MKPRFCLSQQDAGAWLRALPSGVADLIVTERAERMTPEVFAEAHRVLRANGHLYVFCCGVTTMFSVKPMGEDAGFKFWKSLIWNTGKKVCFIPFFEKGKRNLNSRSTPDVLESVERPTHVLVGESSNPGDLVIDPFMGSGSVGVAAVRAGRRFWGNDVSDRAVKLARARLSAEGALEVNADTLSVGQLHFGFGRTG